MNGLTHNNTEEHGLTETGRVMSHSAEGKAERNVEKLHNPCYEQRMHGQMEMAMPELPLRLTAHAKGKLMLVGRHGRLMVRMYLINNKDDITRRLQT